MEMRIAISERAAFVLLIFIAMVSAIGITMATSGVSHGWDEIVCDKCIGAGDLADGAVTNAKIESVGWGKITSVPSGLGDGDDVGFTECYTTNQATGTSSATATCDSGWIVVGGACSYQHNHYGTGSENRAKWKDVGEFDGNGYRCEIINVLEIESYVYADGVWAQARCCR
jgi:hypothetical protein